jgi:hypothetical protein
MTMRSRRLTGLPVCLVAVAPSIQLLIVIVDALKNPAFSSKLRGELNNLYILSYDSKELIDPRRVENVRSEAF